VPWVRIDENAMDHPKIGSLPDGAFRLWVQGLAYCQKHLTDGAMTTLAVRSLLAFSPKRHAVLVTHGLWDETASGVQVHDYLEWNDSREHVMSLRTAAKERMKRARDRSRERTPNSEPRDGERSPFVLRGVVCSEREDARIEKKERGVGKTREERAGDFNEWYADTHQRLFGIGYMGTNGDYTKALELVDRFTDEELRDGALVWFGMDDTFAITGTRTIPKFASRITGCLQKARARGIA
jgi:hypothetical protein